MARELTDLVRPLVLDVRGRGLSGDGPCTLEAYARDTDAVIRDLGLERPLLLGHSMGARIAAVTALRGTAEVAGTVLVDPPMSGPGRGRTRPRWPSSSTSSPRRGRAPTPPGSPTGGRAGRTANRTCGPAGWPVAGRPRSGRPTRASPRTTSSTCGRS
ncbi:alpha/beta fold hydrolase [Streptomyces albus]